MKFATSARLVVGGTAKDRSCQVWSTDDFFIVVETWGDEAETHARSFLADVKTALERQHPKTLKELKLTLRFIKGDDVKTAYVAGLISDVKFLVVVERAGQIWLSRHDKQAAILTTHGSGSGTLKKEDTVVLASGGMMEAVKAAELKRMLELPTPEATAEQLSRQLHTREPAPIAGAVIFHAAESVNTSPQRFSLQLLKDTVLRLGNRWWGRRRRAFYTNRHSASFTLIVALLILLLVGSVGLGLRQQWQKRSHKEVESILTESTHKLDEGMALIDLNPLRARELLAEAKTQLEIGQTKGLGGDAVVQLRGQLTKVEAGLILALRRSDVTLTPFYELSLVKPGGVGVDMSLYRDVLAILDARNKTLYTLSISSKAARVVAGGESFKEGRFVAVHGEDIFVFDESLKKVVVPGGYLTEVVSVDPTWGEVADIAVYAGNVYLLDTTHQQIWKYSQTETGFSPRRNYLLPDTLPDLSGVTEMVVDGSVWVVKGREIVRFIQGGEAVWQVIGLDENLGERISLYTDDTTKNIYILDQEKKRVVAVDKDGTYLSQYRWSESIAITDFVASEVLKKILLLAGGTIYAIELK